MPGAQEPGAFVAFDDLVYGAQSFNVGRELGDVILRRSDGLYAYQFVVTVDDLLMGVSDVVRGRDLLRSTALQIWLRGQMLRTGLGSHNLPAADPQYAHVPLLDNAAGVRLAKRRTLARPGGAARGRCAPGAGDRVLRMAYGPMRGGAGTPGGNVGAAGAESVLMAESAAACGRRRGAGEHCGGVARAVMFGFCTGAGAGHASIGKLRYCDL